MSQLTNPRIIICFDMARDLFLEGKIERGHDFVYLAVRRAARIIQTMLGNGEQVLFVFLESDPNIIIFPRCQEEKEGVAKIYAPIQTHKVDLSHHASPILAQRIKENFRFNTGASDPQVRATYASMGRPLWRTIHQNSIGDWPQCIRSVSQNICPSLIESDEVEFSFLAMRLPLTYTVGERHSVAALVSQACATLLQANPLKAQYLADPILMAAGSYVVGCEVRQRPNWSWIGEKWLKRLRTEICGSREFDIFVMLMAVASTDHVSKYEPYLAINFMDWLGTWLGWTKEDRIKFSQLELPYEFQTAMMSCGQFVQQEKFDWRTIRLALVEAVGYYCPSEMVPVDVIIPFETKEGMPGFLAVQIRSPERLLFSSNDLYRWCQEFHNPGRFPILPLCISFAYSHRYIRFSMPKVYVITGVDQQEEFPLELEEANTWQLFANF